MMYQLCVSNFNCVCDSKAEDNHESILSINIPYKTIQAADRDAREQFNDMWEDNPERPEFKWDRPLGVDYWEFDDGEDTYRIYEIKEPLE